MWTDRRTDLTKLIVAFRNFAKAPKNWDPSTKYRTRQPYTETRSSTRHYSCSCHVLFITIHVLINQINFFPSRTFLGLPSGHFRVRQLFTFFTKQTTCPLHRKVTYLKFILILLAEKWVARKRQVSFRNTGDKALGFGVSTKGALKLCNDLGKL